MDRSKNLYFLKALIRIVNDDDKLVVLNDFRLLPTNELAGTRRMIRSLKKNNFWPKMVVDGTNAKNRIMRYVLSNL